MQADYEWNKYINRKTGETTTELVVTAGGNTTDFVHTYYTDLSQVVPEADGGERAYSVERIENTSELDREYVRGIGYLSGGPGKSEALESIDFSDFIPSKAVLAGGAKIGAKMAAAFFIKKESELLLPQFTKSAIEEGAKYVMSDSKKLNHIFNNADHGLDNLVNALGGRENTLISAMNAANGTVVTGMGKRGSNVFFDIPVTIQGSPKLIRGAILNGVPVISNILTPKL